MSCPRCGRPHTQKEWDEIRVDWQTFFVSKKGYSLKRAFDLSHREMRKHGPRPGGPSKPPLWMRLGARAIAGGDAVAWLKKAWDFLNGKKIFIVAVVVAVPVVAQNAHDLWCAWEGGTCPAGADKILIVAASILAVAHRLFKILGWAAPPAQLDRRNYVKPPR